MYFCTEVNSVMYQKTAVVFRPLRSSSVGDRLGPRVSLDRRGKSRRHRHLIPGPSSP